MGTGRGGGIGGTHTHHQNGPRRLVVRCHSQGLDGLPQSHFVCDEASATMVHCKLHTLSLNMDRPQNPRMHTHNAHMHTQKHNQHAPRKRAHTPCAHIMRTCTHTSCAHAHTHTHRAHMRTHHAYTHHAHMRASRTDELPMGSRVETSDGATCTCGDWMRRHTGMW